MMIRIEINDPDRPRPITLRVPLWLGGARLIARTAAKYLEIDSLADPSVFAESFYGCLKELRSYVKENGHLILLEAEKSNGTRICIFI